jgi:hypothetical protein
VRTAPSILECAAPLRTSPAAVYDEAAVLRGALGFDPALGDAAVEQVLPVAKRVSDRMSDAHMRAAHGGRRARCPAAPSASA